MILVVQSQQETGQQICDCLSDIDFACHWVTDSAQALVSLSSHSYSLAILDVTLNKGNGFELCRCLKQDFPHLAIMFVSRCADESDRVLGLELGADDYIVAPYSKREFQARVKAVMRRAQVQEQVGKLVAVGRFTLDERRHRVELDGEHIELTATEFTLLHYLASHPNQVFSRAQLLQAVWGYAHSGYEHTVNSHINRLRSKLEDDSTRPAIVQTVWGVGYKFNSQGVMQRGMTA